MIIGTTVITPTAAISRHATPVIDRNKLTVVGKVVELELVKNRANTNSFQEKITQNIAVAISPGNARGKSMRINTWNLEQPSIKAASSISSGISSKNPPIIHMV